MNKSVGPACSCILCGWFEVQLFDANEKIEIRLSLIRDLQKEYIWRSTTESNTL